MQNKFRLCSYIDSENVPMAFIEHIPSAKRRHFSCIHSAVTIPLKEASEFKTDPQKQSKIIENMRMIGEKEYQQYGITCETRLKGINSYIEGIATLFNESDDPIDVFDQLIQADQSIGSTDYSLNGEIASFVAKYEPSLNDQYHQFLLKKHKIGTPEEFCNGLIADAEKFYNAEEREELLAETGCECPVEIDNPKIVSVLHPKCYSLVNKVNLQAKLDNIPDNIFHFTEMTSLNLSHNHIKIIPPEIELLKQLHILQLNSNNIKSIPHEIGNLSYLQALYLNDNDLSTLPKSIGKLHDLRAFTINSNHITTLPQEIGDMRELRELVAYENRLNTIPSSVTKLSKLWHLDISNNNIMHLPDNIGNIIELSQLGLKNNPLSNLPPSLCLKLKNNIVVTEDTVDYTTLCAKWW